MGWELSVFSAVLLLAGALAVCTTVLLWRERPRKGATALAVTTAALALWSVSQFVVLSSTLTEVMISGYVGTMLASVLLTTAWVVFTIQYTGREYLLSRRTVGLALVVPALAVVAGVTNEPVGFHDVMLGGVSIDDSATVPELEYELGIGTWLTTLYIWGLAMVGNWFLWKKFVVSRNVYRKRTLLLLLIGVVVLVSTAVSLAEIGPFPSFSLTPVVFLFLAPVIVAVIVSYRTLSFMPMEPLLRPFSGNSRNLTPIARDTIIEEMSIGVLVVDHENRIVDLNPAARTILGADRRLVGRELTTVIDPDLFLEDETPFLEPRVTDETFEGVWIELDDGERRCYDVTISSRGLDGRPGEPSTRVILITEETDRERRRERLESRAGELARQNRQLEDFAHVVSHDLRNPVNVASGYLDLAQEDGTDEHFDQVRSAHERIETLIDDVLLMVRQGKTVEETAAVDLETVGTRAWSHVETHDASIEFEVDGEIQADPSRLLQLLENLFRNAIEHAGRSVTVRVGTTQEGFFVEDDGPGVPAGDREKIFEKGVTGSESGTGLGLAIVSTIVEAHGWSIEVTDGPGGGARFEVDVTQGATPETLSDLSPAPPGAN